MTIEERRKYKRVAVKIPAAVYSKKGHAKIYDAEIIDLSEGGCFVKCKAPITLGEEIVVEIHFAGTRVLDALVTQPGHDKFKASSVVRWVPGMDKGFGVEFEHPTQETREFIKQIVEFFDHASQKK